jgi:hypothetical protein
MSREWWGFIFLMVVLKIPIAYLAGVIWYACKEPQPPEPAMKVVEEPETDPRCPWGSRRFRRGRPRHPFGPTRRVPSAPRVARAYAHRR